MPRASAVAGGDVLSGDEGPNDVKSMTVVELRKALGACGQDKRGKKADLVARLVHLMLAPEPASGTDAGGAPPPPAMDEPPSASSRIVAPAAKMSAKRRVVASPEPFANAMGIISIVALVATIFAAMPYIVWVASPAGTAPPFGIGSIKALKAAIKVPALKAAFRARVAELRNVDVGAIIPDSFAGRFTSVLCLAAAGLCAFPA